MLSLVLIFTGLFSGLMAGLMGIGGGAITLSLLTMAQQVNIYPDTLAMATGLASAQSLFAASSGAVVHHKQGRVCWPMVLLMGLTAMLGGYFGGYLTAAIPTVWLRSLFSALLLGMIINLWRKISKSKHQDNQQDVIPTSLNQLWQHHRFTTHLLALALTAVASALAGVFGIGGSIFLIPVMVGLYALPLPMAVGSGSITAAIIAGASLWGKWQYGLVDPPSAAIIGVASIAGGIIGAQYTAKVSRNALAWILLGLMAWAMLQNTQALFMGA